MWDAYERITKIKSPSFLVGISITEEIQWTLQSEMEGTSMIIQLIGSDNNSRIATHLRVVIGTVSVPISRATINSTIDYIVVILQPCINEQKTSNSTTIITVQVCTAYNHHPLS